MPVLTCGRLIEDCLNCKYPDCINERVFDNYGERGTRKERLERKKRNAQARKEKAEKLNLCYRCFKRPRMEGIQLCEVCREKSLISNRKYSEKRKLERKIKNGNQS